MFGADRDYGKAALCVGILCGLGGLALIGQTIIRCEQWAFESTMLLCVGATMIYTACMLIRRYREERREREMLEDIFGRD